MQMPDIAVATNAGKRSLTRGVASARMCIDCGRYLFVAVATGKFSDPTIAFIHPNRFMKSVGCEIVGMPEAVRGFRQILTDKTRRSMTIVAGGNRVMTRLDPPVVLVVHDMAIRASFWVITQIGITLGIDKREATDPDGGTQRHSKQNSLKS
jgi:hypothetical protein